MRAGCILPLCPRHRRIGQDCVAGGIEADLEELDDRAPERVQLVDRPLPEFFIVGKAKSVLALKPEIFALTFWYVSPVLVWLGVVAP